MKNEFMKTAKNHPSKELYFFEDGEFITDADLGEIYVGDLINSEGDVIVDKSWFEDEKVDISDIIFFLNNAPHNLTQNEQLFESDENIKNKSYV
jgi:hypothetical protein